MASWIWATDANAGAVGEMTRFKAWGISWESWAMAKVLPTPTTASVVVKSVPDMVSKVLAAAGSDKITRLMLFGHSKSGAQAVGAGSRILLSSLVSDFLAVDPATGTLYNGAEQELAKLVPRLDSNARVSLGGCEVASQPKGPASFNVFLLPLAALRSKAAYGTKIIIRVLRDRSFAAQEIPAQRLPVRSRNFDDKQG